MNAFVFRAAMLLTLGGTTWATEPQVRVAASRELRLAIVDSNRETEARNSIHRAFAASLGAALAKQCGGEVGIREKCVGLDHAVFNLRAGVYDAVLVVGRDVPTPLRRANVIALSAVPSGAKKERTLHLLILEGDESLQRLLASGFTSTIGDEKFLQVIAIADGRAVPGEKVAAGQ